MQIMKIKMEKNVTYILKKKITIYKKILYELSLSGRRVENLKFSSQLISQKSLISYNKIQKHREQEHGEKFTKH